MSKNISPTTIQTEVLAVPESLSCTRPRLPLRRAPLTCTSVALSTSCPQSLPPALRPSSCPQGSHSSTHSLTTCSCFLGVSLPAKLVRPEVWHGPCVYQPQPSHGSSRDLAQAESPPHASRLLTSSNKDSKPM